MLNEESMATTLVFLTRWLTSLQSAKAERKQESVAALRQMVIAVGDTGKFLAELRESRKGDARIEARLAREWTKLSHLMGNIGNAGLAKRCRVKGGLWADSSTLPVDYIEKTKQELLAVEKLLEQVLVLA